MCFRTFKATFRWFKGKCCVGLINFIYLVLSYHFWPKICTRKSPPSVPWVNILLFTKFIEYIHYQVKDMTSHIAMNKSCIKKSNSSAMEDVHTQKTWHIKVTHNEVNFDVICDGHQNPQDIHKICFSPILTQHVTSKFTSLCVNFIVSSFFVNLLTSRIVDMWDLFDIRTHDIT